MSSILELSRRSLKGVKAEVLKRKKGHKPNWKSCFLCMWFEVEGEKNKKNENGEDNDVAASSSLGHFLAVERKAASENRRNQSLIVSSVYDDDDEDHEFVLAQTQRVMCDEPNSLFVNGCIAPPQGCITTSSSSLSSSTSKQGFERDRESGGLNLTHNTKRFGSSLSNMFSCMRL